MYISVCAYMHFLHIHTYMYTHMCMRMHVCVCIFLSLSLTMCVYTSMFIYLDTCAKVTYSYIRMQVFGKCRYVFVYT